MDDLIGQIYGSYRLIRLIGSGGFANVYLGEHKLLSTKAAIKILGVDRLEEHETERFLQEAKIIAELRHPNIIRLLEFSIQDGRPFLVMEYVPGGTLADLHVKGITLTLPKVVSYVKQVAAALQYAHERDLIHRDVKPSNMLVLENGEIVLSDFGIAVVRTDSSSGAGGENMAGTIMFMAPEQILGKARPASDQYALAMTTYLWLCGTYPFQGSFGDIVSKHLHMQPPPPSKFNPTIPPVVEQVLLKALAKRPQDRFDTVEEFAQSLEQASLGQEVAILERPPRSPSGSLRWESTVIPEYNPWESRPPQDLPAANLWGDKSFYGPPTNTQYPPPPYAYYPYLLPTPEQTVRDRPIGSLLRFLTLLLTYLLVMPLLILLTPFLLLFYYYSRAQRKGRETPLTTPKRPGRMATILSSLPLPKGFWPTRLLVGEPAAPLSLDYGRWASGGITYPPTVMFRQEPLQRSTKRKVFWLKALWTHVAYFVVKGPFSLHSPKPQLHVHEPPEAQQLYTYGPPPPPPPHYPYEPYEPPPPPQLYEPLSIHAGSQAQTGIGTTTGGRKNFCMIYHSNDRNWAEWIAWLLEEDGLSSIMPEWDFRAGFNVDKEVRKAIGEAERVIVIVSPDYLDARNTPWGTVFSREMMSREGMILPIIVKECALRKPLDTLVSINLVGRDIFHASEKLRKAVRWERSKPTKPPAFPPIAHLEQEKEASTTSGPQSTRRLEPDRDQQQNVSTGASTGTAFTDTTDPKGAKTIRFSAASEEATISLSQMAAQIESAFDRKDWPDVLRKSKFLAQQLPPTDIPWKIYRMQALAYHAQGQMEAARTALENALTLMSNREERLALLDEYANALASLKRWQEMLIYAEEALTIAPNDIRWQALREQITKQMMPDKPLEPDVQLPTSIAQDRTIREADQQKEAGRGPDELKELPIDQTVGQMETMVASANPISIFIAYAPNDAELCDNLKNQLTTLIYQHRLRIWYDHDISPGKERMKIMEERLNASHMIILLVSAYFLGSEYHHRQMQLALELHRAGTKRIIPILLRPSDWEKTPLGELQALPKDNRPVTTWRDMDEALVNIVKGIRLAVEELQAIPQ